MVDENNNVAEPGENSALGAEGGASEDEELLQALETLRRVVGRPKRAPHGTNDVWGWSTDQEHALEPGTEPREQVAGRIRKSYETADGSSAVGRSEREVAALETIAHFLDKIKERPEYSKHDLKRVVKALETIVADRIGPGDEPPDPSTLLVAPGRKSGRQMAEDLAKPVLTPEEETLDYSYIVSDHPVIADLVREHGLTTVWFELLRLRFDLPTRNEEIADKLSKVALAMQGVPSPGVEVYPHPKMYVDENGNPVPYDEARSTDFLADGVFVEHAAQNIFLISALEQRMDKSGRRADYGIVRTLGEEMTQLADQYGDRGVWLDLMRLRYGPMPPRNSEISTAIQAIAGKTSGLLKIPAGEEDVPVRLIADLKNEYSQSKRDLAAIVQDHHVRQQAIESGTLGHFVKLAPWNTYVRVPDPDEMPAPAQAEHSQPSVTETGAAGSEANSGAGGDESHKTKKALESIEHIASEELQGPAAGILADALRVAASQIEQQAGIAASGVTAEESAQQAKKTQGPQRIERAFEKEGLVISYIEGKKAKITFNAEPSIPFYRELCTWLDRDNYQRYKKNWEKKRDFVNYFPQNYKDGMKKETWASLTGLDRNVSWNQLPADGLDKDNPYYPFSKDYVAYALAMRDLYHETFEKFTEAQKVVQNGPVAKLKQVWNDHAEGVKDRIWAGWQLYYWHLQFHTNMNHYRDLKPRWELHNQFSHLTLPKSGSELLTDPEPDK